MHHIRRLAEHNNRRMVKLINTNSFQPLLIFQISIESPKHRSSRREKRGNRSRKTEAGHLETTSTTKDKEKGNCYNDNHCNSYTNNNRDNNNINHVHSNYCNEEMIRFYWTLSVVEVLFSWEGGRGSWEEEKTHSYWFFESVPSISKLFDQKIVLTRT